MICHTLGHERFVVSIRCARAPELLTWMASTRPGWIHNPHPLVTIDRGRSAAPCV